MLVKWNLMSSKVVSNLAHSTQGHMFFWFKEDYMCKKMCEFNIYLGHVTPLPGEWILTTILQRPFDDYSV